MSAKEAELPGASRDATAVPPDAPSSLVSAPNAVQGSNVREAFRLMATLIYPGIPLAYLDCCARILQRRHMDTVFEERSVQLLCAFPPCANRLREKNAKYRVSLKKKEIYDARMENQFCSEQCLKKARVYTSRLVAKPPQLVPSLEDVFGTDKPNPFEWEKQQLALQADAKGDGAVAPHRRNHTRRRTQEAKTVWSKTSDLGVVERPTATDPSQLLASLAAATPSAISENAAPAAPASEFPDASQAVVIEGFVFPSHKESLAKKVERKWQDTAKTRGDEIIVSDSEESDVGDDEDDASSTSSVDESDYDPDDVEGEIISTDDLPPFINLWRILSEWITHDTTLLVANKPLSVKPAPAPPRNAQEKKDREQAERAAQLTFNDRYNALSLMLGRPLPHVAQQLLLTYDRYASHRIDSLLKTFELRDAIDGRHSQQWSCIAALLLLVAHNKDTKTMPPELLSSVQRITKLDLHELEQLLALFYTMRNDSEIVVDDDVAPLAANDDESEAKQRAAAYDAVKKCRRCRRPQAKCVCSERAKQKKAETEFSTDEIAQMFQDAVTLRELNEDLVEAAGGAYDDVD